MTELRTIEIDFDIHKLVEAERKGFSEPPYLALRRLLKLPPVSPHIPMLSAAVNARRPWSGDGVTLEHGTALRMRYNGRQHSGEIIDGKWSVDGQIFDSPSGAASGVAITKKGHSTRLDGWIYWEIRRPGEMSWTPIGTLRPERRHVVGTLEELGL